MHFGVLIKVEGAHSGRRGRFRHMRDALALTVAKSPILTSDRPEDGHNLCI